MKKYTFIKTIIFYSILLITTLVSGQKLKFKIENDSINKKIFLTTIDDEVLKSIYEKENVFEVEFLNFDEGYYQLKKDDKSIVLYLKPTDELKISFDNNDFYRTLNFSGEGSYVNTYLLNKKIEFLDKKGVLRDYYKKEFYEGDEAVYLNKLDKLYRENYGVLFGGQLDKKFVDEEMKNLKYGYSLDVLKYQEAKKYYKFHDSLAPSNNFLQPVNEVNLNNNQLYEKYHSYKELRVLKWKKEIDNESEYISKQKVFSSIRNKSLKAAVLESMYKGMNRRYPQKSIDYYNLIKKNSKNNKLILQAKEKYALLEHLEAQKNLSKFQFLNKSKEPAKLSDFKGKYIFINVWTTWCAPCVKEFEELRILEEKFKKEGIVFVSISVDKIEEIDTWVEVVKENNTEGINLFLNDSKSDFILTYGIASIPSYLLISPKGVKLDTEISKIASSKTEKLLNDLFKK